MKTSIIEVHDMLAVLTVDEVEKRICEVPGVESATANFAAGNVTVRYDETRLDVAEIKATVHQRGQQPVTESVPAQAREHEPERKPTVHAAPDAPPTSESLPAAPGPKTASVAPAAPAVDVHKGHEGHAVPAIASPPVAAAPNAPTDALGAVPANATPHRPSIAS